jgi:hypothetical protein
MVFLLDDFDLAYQELGLEETSWMRPWREFAAFVLAVERRLEDVNPLAMGSPFWGNLVVHRLGPLRRTEAEKVFNASRRLDQQQPQWMKECADLALDLAGGHPYLVMKAAAALSELVEGSVLDSDVPPFRDYKIRLRGRLQADFRPAFHMYRERLDPIERSVLLALARGDQLTVSQRVRLAALVDLGLVEQDPPGAEPGFRPFSPLFRDFLVESDLTPTAAAPTLTDNEQRIYSYMRHRIGEICSFQDLWAASSDETQLTPPADIVAAVQTAISRLRPKLRITTGEELVSVRNQGYKLVSSVRSSPH